MGLRDRDAWPCLGWVQLGGRGLSLGSWWCPLSPREPAKAGRGGAPCLWPRGRARPPLPRASHRKGHYIFTEQRCLVGTGCLRRIEQNLNYSFLGKKNQVSQCQGNRGTHQRNRRCGGRYLERGNGCVFLLCASQAWRFCMLLALVYTTLPRQVCLSQIYR